MLDYQIDAGGLLIGKGTWYDLRRLDGWDSAPDSKRDESSNDTDHGAYIGDEYVEPRVITAEIGVHGAHHDDTVLAERLDALRAVMVPDVDDPTLTGLFPGQASRYVTAERRRLVVPRQGGAGLRLTVCLAQWTCGNPREYGTSEYSNDVLYDSVQVLQPNAGNYRAPFVARFHGPVTNPRLIDDVRGIATKLTMTIGAGDYVDVDTLAGTALSDAGSNNYGNVTEFDLVDVPRGGRLMRATGTGTDGNSKVELIYRDTWL